jgi:prepilin-type N-terminal cleavage/methylation domain-containing protein
MEYLTDRGFQSHSSSADVRAHMKRFENIRALARRQEGFGLIELLTAMVILAIAVAALLTAFSASALSLHRAGEQGTATTLAERQLELYRKLAWEDIRIAVSQLPGLPTPYLTASATDSWFPPSPLAQVYDSTTTICSAAVVAFPDPCAPVQIVRRGPDGLPYRVDTYIKYDESGGVSIKRVWVVVYQINGDSSVGSLLARASSSYSSFNYAVQPA